MLILSGSPRREGNSDLLCDAFMRGAAESGNVVEKIRVADQKIGYCRACYYCRQHEGACHTTGSGKCVFDDIVNETAPKLAAADAFVIGSPVYFASPAGGAISFMDRLFFSTLNMDKTMKVGAAVVTCRRGGNTATFDVLNKYFSMTGMPIATSQYWNMVHGGTPEEVLRDREGLQTMRTLGRNMAFLMKSIRLGKEQLGLPEKEETIFTNFHH